jgi:hypothetical protein
MPTVFQQNLDNLIGVLLKINAALSATGFIFNAAGPMHFDLIERN